MDEYLVDLNASAAARRAGYSPKTAHRMGQENMQKPAIQDAIQAAMAKRSEVTGIDAESILRDLRIVAEMGMGLRDSPTVAIIDGKVVPYQEKIVNLPAAKAALEQLGKHNAMWTDKTATSIEAGEEIKQLLAAIATTTGPPSDR